MSVQTTSLSAPRPDRLWYVGQSAFVAVWCLVYRQLIPLSELITSFSTFELHSHTGEAIAFFFFDVTKMMMLLTLIVFAMGVVCKDFSPEPTLALLAGKREGVGDVMAAALGVTTPICWCSVVPLLIGLVSAGVPLGAKFSFLELAPVVNEEVLALLFGLVGWKSALTYAAFGLIVAIFAGWAIRNLKLEGGLKDWGRDIHSGATAHDAADDFPLTTVDCYHLGIEAVREIFGRGWMWIILGIGMGVLIHSYVPADLMARIMSADAWRSLHAAVVVSIPLYTNAAGVIPIVEALLGQGAALGTALAFMMSTIALSLAKGFPFTGLADRVTAFSCCGGGAKPQVSAYCGDTARRPSCC